MPLLLELEALTNAREAAAIEVALVVGIRAGRAEAHAAEHDELTTELIRVVAVMGLNLTRLQRLRAFVELLALEVSEDDDTDL